MPYGESWRERQHAFAKFIQGGNPAVYQNPAAGICAQDATPPPRQSGKYPSHNAAVSVLIPARRCFWYSITVINTPHDQRHRQHGFISAYGLPIQSSNDPLMSLAQPSLPHVPGWIPGDGFQKKARKWKKLQEDFLEVPYDEAVKQMAVGGTRPSFMSTFLQDIDQSKNVKHQQDVIKDTAAVIFAGKALFLYSMSSTITALRRKAGADTTVASIHTFFATMLSYPELQKKAQQELDGVLRGRVPEFGDEADLLYISAIVKEVETCPSYWRAHYSSEDDVYGGYHIPKGAMVIANAWAMLFDEDEYPDPSTFKPERFLNNGQLNPAIRDPALMAFGFGRRMCPGVQVAISALWLTVATTLATFDISNAVGDVGVPDLKYRSALICHPLPFKCTLKPRSKDAEVLIRSAGDSY
ncbi:hypothetical protein GALMADRAFT_161978 [Galerina marginata CBS 339.88]|uniref:Cytochrome P450 n=1 Tax=Galerina marginata (strain CBS 339.88) TaxID=685588 RepID=A0A067SFR4_GALM3|nr:hypothetical protein GALMADRAFT_161978 [Galerina marginata CBS 339.88]